MRTRLLMSVILLTIVGAPLAGAEPVAILRGGGAFGDRGGIYENHQPYFDHVSVNARLNDDFTAEGMIIWTSEWNAFFQPHPDNYSKQWRIRVEGWFGFEDGTVIVFGTVTHATLESETGAVAYIPFFDGGPGNPDHIFGFEIDGNIVLK